MKDNVCLRYLLLHLRLVLKLATHFNRAPSPLHPPPLMSPHTVHRYVAPGNLGVPPPPNKIRGPYRVSELRAFVKDGHLSASSLVCAGFVESYVDEDGAELQVGLGEESLYHM